MDTNLILNIQVMKIYFPHKRSNLCVLIVFLYHFEHINNSGNLANDENRIRRIIGTMNNTRITRIRRTKFVIMYENLEVMGEFRVVNCVQTPCQ